MLIGTRFDQDFSKCSCRGVGYIQTGSNVYRNSASYQHKIKCMYHEHHGVLPTGTLGVCLTVTTEALFQVGYGTAATVKKLVQKEFWSSLDDIEKAQAEARFLKNNGYEVTLKRKVR